MDKIKLTLDGNGAVIKGNENIEQFQEALFVFAESLPDGSELIVTDFELHFDLQPFSETQTEEE